MESTLEIFVENEALSERIEHISEEHMLKEINMLHRTFSTKSLLINSSNRHYVSTRILIIDLYTRKTRAFIFMV